MRKMISTGGKIKRIQAQYDTRSIVFNWKQEIQAQYRPNKIIYGGRQILKNSRIWETLKIMFNNRNNIFLNVTE